MPVRPQHAVGPRPVRRKRTFREFVDEDGNMLVRETQTEDSRLREDGAGVDLEFHFPAPPMYSCGCPQTEPLGVTCMIPGCGRQSCKAHVAYCERCRMPLCAPHAGPTSNRCPLHRRDDDGTPWSVLASLVKGRRRVDAPPNAPPAPTK